MIQIFRLCRVGHELYQIGTDLQLIAFMQAAGQEPLVEDHRVSYLN